VLASHALAFMARIRKRGNVIVNRNGVEVVFGLFSALFDRSEKERLCGKRFAVSEAIDAAMLWRSLIHRVKEQMVELLSFRTMLPL